MDTRSRILISIVNKFIRELENSFEVEDTTRTQPRLMHAYEEVIVTLQQQHAKEMQRMHRKIRAMEKATRQREDRVKQLDFSKELTQVDAMVNDTITVQLQLRIRDLEQVSRNGVR